MESSVKTVNPLLAEALSCLLGKEVLIEKSNDAISDIEQFGNLFHAIELPKVFDDVCKIQEDNQEVKDTD